ncbi:hypothetical protein BDV93DRAFT_505948 [Ceratobasidium sp. AG-I]|nr:hypothetical protein BDV93DRAFT_505948 [Ceratobasidium sp. AG-I]
MGTIELTGRRLGLSTRKRDLPSTITCPNRKNRSPRQDKVGHPADPRSVLAASGANARGYVTSVVHFLGPFSSDFADWIYLCLAVLVIDANIYETPVPGGARASSLVHQNATTSPWKIPIGPGIACGPNATNFALVAPVVAGSTIKLTRAYHSGAKRVPTGQTADNFNPTRAGLFKIAQVGKQGEAWSRAQYAGHGTSIEAGF